jgi:hypothetical protein
MTDSSSQPTKESRPALRCRAHTLAVRKTPDDVEAATSTATASLRKSFFTIHHIPIVFGGVFLEISDLMSGEFLAWLSRCMIIINNHDEATFVANGHQNSHQQCG